MLLLLRKIATAHTGALGNASSVSVLPSVLTSHLMTFAHPVSFQNIPHSIIQVLFLLCV